MPSTILIGAGIAGLAAARKLIQKGHTVTVLDKGRGVGGRMATRRIDRSRLDHGAQYFTTRRPEFQELVEQLLLEGEAGIWPIDDVQETATHYIGRDGMSSIPKYLAQSVPVITGERVVRLEKTDVDGAPCWRVFTDTQHTYEANNLLISMPAPQALTLLRDSGITPDEADFPALEQIQYTPCITVMAVLSAPSKVPSPGAVRLDQGPATWIADNYQKGISPDQHAITVQAGAPFSTAHFEEDLMAVGQMLIDSVSDFIPPQSIVTYQVHRWRYSLADTRHPKPFLMARTPAPMVFGGDGFGLGNIEGAYLSGLAMADALGR